MHGTVASIIRLLLSCRVELLILWLDGLGGLASPQSDVARSPLPSLPQAPSLVAPPEREMPVILMHCLLLPGCMLPAYLGLHVKEHEHHMSASG